MIDATETMRLFQYRVKHRGEVPGRGIDDLQYLGSRGLLLQCLARFGYEARVFHRNDRLGREVLQQRNLIVGERADFLAVDRDHTEQRIVLAQRYSDKAASATNIHQRADWGP